MKVCALDEKRGKVSGRRALHCVVCLWTVILAMLAPALERFSLREIRYTECDAHGGFTDVSRCLPGALHGEMLYLPGGDYLPCKRRE